MNVLRLALASGYAATMGYWVKRIVLQDGEVVTERELREHENRFDGPALAIGKVIEVRCRGRNFMAEVVWGNPPGRAYSENTVVPLRVSEVGLDPTTPLRFPKPRITVSQEWPYDAAIHDPQLVSAKPNRTIASQQGCGTWLSQCSPL